MISRIELQEMKFYAHHGVSPQETAVGNTFIVDLILTAPLHKAVETDELAYTVNYADVYSVVEKEMLQPSRLLEHVAGRILGALKKRFPELSAVQLKVSKINPPFGGDIRCASVILEESWLS